MKQSRSQTQDRLILLAAFLQYHRNWVVLTTLALSGILFVALGLIPSLGGLSSARAHNDATPLIEFDPVEQTVAPYQIHIPAFFNTTTPQTEASLAQPVTTPPPAASPVPTVPPVPPPWPTPDGAAHQASVPILMYHYLSDAPEGADRYRVDLSVSPALFEQQLAYLQQQGYQSISLYDLLGALTQGLPLPEKPVIITFDDGYRDNYENALPLLSQYGFTATFFVLTEVTNLGEPDYMSWDQMRAMQAAGMDIECHARVHEELTANNDERLAWQVLGCSEAIESQLGRRPRFVAYPSGVFDERVIQYFASDNFWGGLTTQQGKLHDSSGLFELKRLRVRSTTTLDRLAALLNFQELP